jgi:hypothetical protein
MKRLIPAGARSFLREQRRQYLFHRALRKFVHSPDPKWIPELINGWNNKEWCALEEYLEGCITAARSANGDILECGSGLSTLLLGAIAQHNNRRVWTLEHDDVWTEKVRGCLDRHRITSVQLLCVPLKDYGEYHWYSPPLSSMPMRFALAVCDGPPGTTKGGRYGLMPVMGDRLAGSTILLDDAGRAEEQEIAKRWSTERRAEYSMLGTKKPYIRMQMS